jgi:hypothetical protein
MGVLKKKVKIMVQYPKGRISGRSVARAAVIDHIQSTLSHCIASVPRKPYAM